MKIAFLFLTKANVNFPQIWEDYFTTNDTTNIKYSIYCHPKYPNQVTIEWMKSNIIKNLVPTEWGHLTNAYIALLKTALEDSSNTHFIYVSESCIPIKSLCKFNKYINKHSLDTSYIDLRELDKYNFNKSDIPANYFSVFKQENLIKHSGWFCLSRLHSLELIAHPDVYKFNKVIAGDEYILSLIYSTNKDFIDFRITYANWSYAKSKVEKINIELKKLYEYQESTGKSKKNEINELRKEKSNLGKHPKTYTKITKKVFNKMLHSKSFFFRKFSEDSSIIRHYQKLLKGC